jgi:hypothetical protein
MTTMSFFVFFTIVYGLIWFVENFFLWGILLVGIRCLPVYTLWTCFFKRPLYHTKKYEYNTSKWTFTNCNAYQIHLLFVLDPKSTSTSTSTSSSPCTRESIIYCEFVFLETCLSLWNFQTTWKRLNQYVDLLKQVYYDNTPPSTLPSPPTTTTNGSSYRSMSSSFETVFYKEVFDTYSE